MNNVNGNNAYKYDNYSIRGKSSSVNASTANYNATEKSRLKSAAYRDGRYLPSNYRSTSQHSYDYNRAEMEKFRYNNEYIKKAEREKARNAALKRAQKIERIIVVALSVAAVFLASIILVYRYVLITELNMEANKLKEQYATISAENESIQNKIDSAVDLKKLQEIATSRLGMVKPESDQIIHIENNNESYGEKVEKKEKTVSENRTEDAAISGVPGSIVRYVTGK